jgi:hypothetical protein
VIIFCDVKKFFCKNLGGAHDGIYLEIGNLDEGCLFVMVIEEILIYFF